MDNCTTNLHVRAGAAGREVSQKIIGVIRQVMASLHLVETDDLNEAERLAAVAQSPLGPWVTIQLDAAGSETRLLNALAQYPWADAHLPGVLSYVRRDTLVGLELYTDGRRQDAFYFDPEAPWPEEELTQSPHDYALWRPVLKPDTTPGDLQREWEEPDEPGERLLSVLSLLDLRVWSELDPFRSPQRADITWLGFKHADSGQRNDSASSPAASEPAVSGSDAPMIPAILQGTPAEVKRRCKTLARKIVKAGSMAKACAQLEMVPLDSVSGEIVLENAFGWAHGVNIYPCYLASEISGACFDAQEGLSSEPQHDAFATRRRLLLEGLDYFWFALCAQNSNAYNGLRVDDKQERARNAALAVGKVLQWWPQFQTISSRLACRSIVNVHWTDSWGTLVRSLLNDMAISRDEVERIRTLDADAAATAIRQLLERSMPKGE